MTETSTCGYCGQDYRLSYSYSTVGVCPADYDRADFGSHAYADGFAE